MYFCVCYTLCARLLKCQPWAWLIRERQGKGFKLIVNYPSIKHLGGLARSHYRCLPKCNCFARNYSTVLQNCLHCDNCCATAYTKFITLSILIKAEGYFRSFCCAAGFARIIDSEPARIALHSPVCSALEGKTPRTA